MLDVRNWNWLLFEPSRKTIAGFRLALRKALAGSKHGLGPSGSRILSAAHSEVCTAVGAAREYRNPNFHQKPIDGEQVAPRQYKGCLHYAGACVPSDPEGICSTWAFTISSRMGRAGPRVGGTSRARVSLLQLLRQLLPGPACHFGNVGMMFGVSAGLPTLSWQGRRGERARAAHLRERRGSPESGLFYKTFEDVDLYGNSCSKARAGSRRGP